MIPQDSSAVEQETSLLTRTKSLSSDRIAAGILFVGPLLLLIFFLPGFNLSIDSGKMLILITFVLLSFFFWLLARLKSGTITIPRDTLFISMGILMVAFFVSALFSPAPYVSLYGFIYEVGTTVSMVALILLMFLTSLFFQSHTKIIWFYQSLLLVFGIIFLFQISRFIFGSDFLSFGGFFARETESLIGKWNDLGIFAGLIALLSIITLERTTLSKRRKIIFYTTLVASLLLLAIVNFYLVWIVVGALSLVVFVYNSSFFRVANKNKSNYAKTAFSSPSFFVMLIAFIFFVSSGVMGNFINQKLNIAQIEVRPSWASTVSVLKETIKDRPLLGSGPNRFSNQWLQFKPDGINNSFFWNTEFRSGIGLLPTFAVTTGVVGALAFSVFLLLLFYRGVQFLFSASNSSSQYTIFSSFLLAVYLWVISFFYVPATAMFAFAFFMTGIFLATLLKEKKIKQWSFSYFENPRASFISVLLLSVLVIGSVTMGYSLVKKTVALKNFNKGRIALNVSGDFNIAEQSINKAIAQDKSDIYYRAISEIKTQQIRGLLARQGVSPEDVRAEFQSLLGEGITSGQLAVQFDETNHLNWLALARVYGSVAPFVSGAYENANVSLSEALSLNPKSPLLLLEHARLEIVNSNNDEARNYIARALQMKPDYANAVFVLAQLKIAEGNIDGAIQSIEQATLIAPNDIGLFFQLGLLRFNNEDYEQAVPAFERAVVLNSDFANAKYFLGLSYFNVDRSQEAIAQFEDLEKTNPNNEEVKRILSNIRAGRKPFANFSEPTSLQERVEPPLDE